MLVALLGFHPLIPPFVAADVRQKTSQTCEVIVDYWRIVLKKMLTVSRRNSKKGKVMLRLKRGKRLDNGEWIVGFYVEIKHHDDDSHVHTFIMIPDKCVDNAEYLDFWVEVFPESVGDETCAASKDGVGIFEGDILQYFDDEIQVVEYHPEIKKMMLHTYLIYDMKHGRKTEKEYRDGWNDLNDYPMNEMRIIGNTFDDRELLSKWCHNQ